jgi:hypothetical protein
LKYWHQEALMTDLILHPTGECDTNASVPVAGPVAVFQRAFPQENFGVLSPEPDLDRK